MAGADLTGRVLAGKYKLAERLGGGGMGEVYRATNLMIGRVVAIKILLPQHAKSPEIAQRFLREARAANLVRHENVVEVTDIGHDEDGTPFIVQEFLEGVDLEDVLNKRGGALPVPEALETLLPVIDAVGCAHQKGVVHRDLKPANVFLAREHGRVVPKLLDFGISQVISTDARMTAAGSMLGTPRFMSPEQVRASDNVDARSDVWSLGVILYQMVSGQKPFHSQASSALFVEICTADPTPIDHLVFGLSRELAAVIHRCLRKAPAERYRSATELAADLRRVQSQPAGDALGVPSSSRSAGAGPPSLHAAPTLAAVAANSYGPDPPPASRPSAASRSSVAAPPSSARPSGAPGRRSLPPDRPTDSRPSMPPSGRPAAAKTPGKQRISFSGDLDVDDPDKPAPEITLAPIEPRPSRRPPPRHSPSGPDFSAAAPYQPWRAGPSPEVREPNGATHSLDSRRLTVLALLCLLIAVGLRGLLYVFPACWPVFVWVVPWFRGLPGSTFLGVAAGGALGAAGAVVGMRARRTVPFPWSAVPLSVGLVLLGVFAAGFSVGILSEPDGHLPALLPLSGSFLPLGVGVHGLQQLWTTRRSEGWVPSVLLAVAGLFVALQLARGAGVEPDSISPAAAPTTVLVGDAPNP